MRRLSKDELSNTIKDLLGATIFAQLDAFITQLPEENISKSVETFTKPYSEIHLKVVADMSLKAAELMTANATTLNGFLSANSSCTNYTTVTDACVNDFIARFGLKVLRHTLSSADVTTFKNFYATGSDNKDKFHSLFLAMLQMPEFLYHVEVGTSGAGGTNQNFDVSPQEIASRLSYHLWNTMPSDTLFAQAASGDLKDATKLDAIVTTMLNDARSASKMKSFISYWLSIKNLPDPSQNANFLAGLDTTGLKAEMEREFYQFVDYIVWQQKKGFKELMTSDVSFAKTATLASIYEHALASNPDAATQKMGNGRKGLLLRGPYLLLTSDRTHPFHRGVQLRKKILCDPLGSPDPGLLSQGPNVDTVEALITMTMQQRLTAKTASPNCMGCHSTINSLGFAMEEYDTVGRRRQNEKVYDLDGTYLTQHPINTSITGLNIENGAPDSSMSGSELVDIVSNSDKGVSCFVRQAFQFYKMQMEDVQEDGCILTDMRDAVSGSSGSIYQGLKKSVINQGLYKKIVK